jgi:D-glycero-alpha-D-manno-heptose-7-phosphate kinase
MSSGSRPRSLTARAPTRVDLAGGTLDLWPLHLFFPGSLTLNAAIDLHSTVRLAAIPSGYELESLDQGRRVRADSIEALDPHGPLPLVARLVRHFAPPPGVRVQTRNLSPPGAGLGGSSSLAVALAGALAEWCGRRLDLGALITLVGNLEAQVLRAPTGTQDYYAALHGGVSLLRLGPEGVRREALPGLDGWLGERLVLCYTGAPHASGIHNWEVYRRAVDGDRATCEALQEIAACAAEMEAAVRCRDAGAAAAALAREWEARKRLAPGVSTPRIEQVIAWGIEAGALAGKVCGAGGGGCLVLVAGEAGGPALTAALRERGVEVLPFGFAAGGLAVSWG